MICETTYPDREITRTIDSLVGPPIPFWDRIKLKGIGSQRVRIVAADPLFEETLSVPVINYFGNIELRTAGILFHFRIKLETYAWAIPFSKLEIKSTPDGLELFAGKLNLRLQSGRRGMINRAFIEKMLMLKQNS